MPIKDRNRRLASQRSYGVRRSKWRAAGLKVDRWILEDSKKSDRLHGRKNNLDRPFISKLIKNGCLYCGETKLRMTLDRINNSVGHIKTNVNPACQRCNYIRRDMPYKAWLALIPTIRILVKRKSFGDWDGCRHYRAK